MDKQNKNPTFKHDFCSYNIANTNKTPAEELVNQRFKDILCEVLYEEQVFNSNHITSPDKLRLSRILSMY